MGVECSGSGSNLVTESRTAMSTFSIGSHAEGPLQRPTMRRKSSAQNLLSSFKTNSGPASLAPLLVSTSTNAISPAYGATPTPTSGSHQGREWDALSLHSAVDAMSIAGAASPAIPQGMSVEYLRDLVQKRIITLTYIRNIHEGCVRQACPHIRTQPCFRQTKSLVSHHFDCSSGT